MTHAAKTATATGVARAPGSTAPRPRAQTADHRRAAGGPVVLVRVLRAEDRPGGPAVLGHHAAARAAEADVRLRDVRSGRVHARGHRPGGRRDRRADPAEP